MIAELDVGLLGILSVILLCGTAFIFSIPAASHTGFETWFSVAAASTAFVAMSLNLFFATRPKYVEPLFGGLDRIYRVHKWLGIFAGTLILVHFLVTPNFQGKILTSKLNELAGDVGEIAFYSLVGLIVFSAVKSIPLTKFEFPYHYWRISHRFIGLFFILAAFHFNFIKRPFDGNALLLTYLNFFAVLGTASYVITQLKPFWAGREYRVSAITKHPTATEITAVPQGTAISSRNGQFAFLSISRSGLREPHPFTIARTDVQTGASTFFIKPLGDFTDRLRRDLEEGDSITIEGGYGRFVSEYGGQKQIWVAGGIGITPFLAMSDSVSSNSSIAIHLIHVVRDRQALIEELHFQRLSQKYPHFSYTPHVTSLDGKFTGKVLVEASEIVPAEAELWFCGPSKMRVNLLRQLSEVRQAPKKVRFEKFEFR